MIYRFIYIKTLGNVQLAEDITQETFIKAWQKSDKFDITKGSLKTWLYTIARNLLIDYLRKAKNHTESINEFEEIKSAISIEKDAEQALLREEMLKSLKSLNQSDEDLIIMRFINELEIKEMAQILNKPENTVKVAIHRAVNKLKKIINNG